MAAFLTLFEPGDQVSLFSGESGVVIGAKRVVGSETEYLVEYETACGEAREWWWRESALSPAGGGEPAELDFAPSTVDRDFDGAPNVIAFSAAIH
ncbi:hypothetical protein HW532_12850 [Kaustia mangrovi]|uniref:Uncharacterized protein n=1 Tax=Kaustia mangrovi TaxID=2593653 RepID=A0A7S8C540_9HYPH|nr:hypothetical protein [Kaustia mangrovi]QPC43506.1 hypothetical protein HW532_12850 [Kaustia mangrovi]